MIGSLVASNIAILRRASYPINTPRHQESPQFGGRLPTEARHLGDLLQRRGPQTLDRSKPLQQCRLSLFADAGKLIKNAFRDTLDAKLGIEGIGDAMRLVTHALEKFQRTRIVTQPQRFALTRAIDLLKLLRQTDDRDATQTKFLQLRAGSV